MRAVKKRPASVEILYFDFTNRLTVGETLLSCDPAPVIILPSPTNTDITWTTLLVNTGGPLYPSPPAAPIAQYKGISATVSGGLLPTDPTLPTSVLPDGTIGTVYEFSFSAVTTLDGATQNRVINEQYQLWVSNDDYPAYWTSHWELNRRYSATAIKQWADTDNTGNTSAALSNIWAAVEEATDDFKQQLRGAPCGIITPEIALQSSGLRRNCTMLAASILYRARGVRDTSDEEGRDRFSSDVRRVEKFLKQIRAGQRRLVDGDVGVTTHPVAVVTTQPYLSVFGPRLTPNQTLCANQNSELLGIPSYTMWGNFTDSFQIGFAG